MKTISFRRLVSLAFVFILLFTLSVPALATSDTNTETYSVIFKAEKGGRFYGDVISSSYENLPYGSVFPTVPKEITDENHEFLGWYDENGNKVDSFPSTVTRNYVFTAKWSNGETTPIVVNFVVKHFLEQLDGTYVEIVTDTTTQSAEVGEIVTTNPNVYENYTFNSEKSVSTGTVILPEVVDGHLNITTLELYYDLNSVECRIEHYIQASPPSKQYSLKDSETVIEKIGKTIVANPNSYDQYELNNSLSTLTGVVKPNLVLKLYYSFTGPISAKYVVKHYLQQNDGSYKEAFADTEIHYATVGEKVSASARTYKNFTFNSEKSTCTSIVTLPSGSDDNLNVTTLSLYYDLSPIEYKIEHYLQVAQHSETYSLEDTEAVTEKIGTPVAVKPNTYDKYVFNRYLSNITGVVKDGLVLKLYYDLKVTPTEPVTVKYVVRHYLQQSDSSYKEVFADAETYYATVGEKVSAKSNTYENYEFNPKKSTTTGTVIDPKDTAGKAEVLTLRMYYDLNETTDSSNPPIGDNISIIVAVLVLSFVLLALLVLFRKKQRSK